MLAEEERDEEVWRTNPEIEEVDQSPANILAHTRDGVDDNLPGDNEYEMDEPCT